MEKRPATRVSDGPTQHPLEALDEKPALAIERRDAVGHDRVARAYHEHTREDVARVRAKAVAEIKRRGERKTPAQRIVACAAARRGVAKGLAHTRDGGYEHRASPAANADTETEVATHAPEVCVAAEVERRDEHEALGRFERDALAYRGRPQAPAALDLDIEDEVESVVVRLRVEPGAQAVCPGGKRLAVRWVVVDADRGGLEAA